jgi:hypothetical protein
MGNLDMSHTQRDFFVWVDPSDFLVRHQVSIVGCFTSTPVETGQPCLMFLPNPDFQTFVSPFQNNLLRAYLAEYNLELGRERLFPLYPSRLQAIFLLSSEDEAHAYAETHPKHVANRILKRAHTNGPYRFSIHDSSWVDFLRQTLMIDQQSLDLAARAYWTGVAVQDTQLQSMGQPWTRERVPEVLFEGRIDFYDRSLPALASSHPGAPSGFTAEAPREPGCGTANNGIQTDNPSGCR